MTDMEKALALVPSAQATAIAIANGLWSNPSTWQGNRLPIDGDKVLISANADVVQDVTSPKLKWLRLDGCLEPQAGANVTLFVETIVGAGMESCFHAGTKDDPFDGQWNIVFTDPGPVDVASDPWVMSRGFIPMGEVDLHGKLIEPWCFTTGNKVGDTMIQLISPCTGWKVGDKIALPGVGVTSGKGTEIQDDDVCTILWISMDLLSVQVAPLKFNHEAKDREGFPRPMFAANISPRSIHFTSENKADITRRGHVMNMRDDVMVHQEYNYVSFSGLGRTNKNTGKDAAGLPLNPITDPDGLGGGFGNPRGRYSLHFHKCNPDINGMEGLAYGCFVEDSPGWGYVNHQSRVRFEHNLGYRIFGAHYTGENGNETGWIVGNVALRSTRPQRFDPNPLGTALPATNFDWGGNSHGIFTLGGGIEIRDNIITGQNNFAIGIAAGGFGSPPVSFAVSNLKPEYIPDVPKGPKGETLTQIPPNWVPQKITGNRFFGCKSGVGCWGLTPKHAGDPIIRATEVTDCGGECERLALWEWYTSNINATRLKVTRPLSDYAGDSYGVNNSGVSSREFFDDCRFTGFGVGMRTPTDLDNAIRNCEFKCNVGLYIETPSPGYPRTLNISGNTFIKPFPTSLDVLARMQESATALRTNDQQFWQYCGARGDCWGPGDQITFNGKKLFYPEQHASFNIGANCPKAAPLVLPLTNGQMFEQFKIAIGGKILPADAVQLAGSSAYVSDTPATYLPNMYVTKLGQNRNWQQTNQLTGYVAKVKGDDGVFVLSDPTNLIDKSWNIVPVQFKGATRGVAVLADSSVIPPANW